MCPDFSRKDCCMRTRLIRIGNSLGVRLPKSLIDEAGLSDEVELHVQDGAIILQPASKIRSGWADATEEIRETGEDLLLDFPTSTQVDEKKWEW